MKLFLIKFAIFVYVNYIQEDWSVITPLGKKILYPLWLIRQGFVWLICPIFLPVFLARNSNIYKFYVEVIKNQI